MKHMNKDVTRPWQQLAGLASALILIACSPGSFEDVSRPALVVTIIEEGGFCSSVHVVDAEGVVWSGGGCGEVTRSLARTERRVDAAERAALDESMDTVLALPNDAECELIATTGRRYRFVRTLSSGGTDEVRQCDPGVPLVARRLADRLEELGEGTFADAGDPADGS